MAEYVVALVGTFLFTRLCAWSFRPTARRAILAAVAAAVAVPWVAVARIIVGGASEGSVPRLALPYAVGIVIWLGIDLWRVERRLQLKDEAAEEYIAREAQRLRSDGRWRRVAEQGEAKDAQVASKSCGACGAVVAPDAKFCDGCGGKIGGECAKCRAQNREGARFCKQCGGPLMGESAQRSA